MTLGMPWQISDVYAVGMGTEVDGGPFPCPQCHRVYKYKRNLSSHQRLSCGKERQFVCSTCGKRFSQKVHLRTHHRSCDRKLLKQATIDESNLKYYAMESFKK